MSKQLVFGVHTVQDAKTMARVENPNPCVKIYDFGPKDKRCKHCVHLFSYGNTRNYFKCDLRRVTHGPATDHRANWQTCGKFEEKK